jgi:hypothetical protein
MLYQLDSLCTFDGTLESAIERRGVCVLLLEQRQRDAQKNSARSAGPDIVPHLHCQFPTNLGFDPAADCEKRYLHKWDPVLSVTCRHRL